MPIQRRQATPVARDRVFGIYPPSQGSHAMPKELDVVRVICVADGGMTIWLADFRAGEVERV